MHFFFLLPLINTYTHTPPTPTHTHTHTHTPNQSSETGSTITITTQSLRVFAEQSVFLTGEERYQVQRAIEAYFWKPQAFEDLVDNVIMKLVDDGGLSFKILKPGTYDLITVEDKGKTFEHVRWLADIRGSHRFVNPFDDRKCS